MKTLLLTLLLLTSIYAEENKTPSLMECEMILAMFEFSVEQGNPVTREQLIAPIEACEPFEKHKSIVKTMKKLLETM